MKKTSLTNSINKSANTKKELEPFFSEMCLRVTSSVLFYVFLQHKRMLSNCLVVYEIPKHSLPLKFYGK